MESDDSMDKIAGFYKKKLAQYGKVLDCSRPAPNGSGDKDENSKELTCSDDKPEKDGLLFKSGSKADQHIVSIQPASKGSLYQLLHIAHWDSDAKR